MKIRAAVLDRSDVEPPYDATRPLAIRDVDLAPPGEGEVLIRIGAAGICHSDLSVVNGDRPRPTPMVLGHEAAGTVEALGRGVDDLVPGDRVVAVFVPSCGHCQPCARGRPALCEPAALANGQGALLAGGRRLSAGGVAINHHVGVSAFAEAAVVSRRSLVKVDNDLPFEVAALFGCAVLTGVGAVINTAAVAAGMCVAIVGLGGVGLAAVLGAVAAGAGRIVAVDLAAGKLEFARGLGATDAVTADEAAVERIRDLTGGGVDVALEMAGSAKALDLAYRITARGGTTVTAGLPHPATTWPLSPLSLVAEERTVKGSYIGTSVPSRDIPRYIALYRRGRLPVNRLVTHRLPLADINAGFERLRRGEAVRQIVLTA